MRRASPCLLKTVLFTPWRDVGRVFFKNISFAAGYDGRSFSVAEMWIVLHTLRILGWSCIVCCYSPLSWPVNQWRILIRSKLMRVCIAGHLERRPTTWLLVRVVTWQLACRRVPFHEREPLNGEVGETYRQGSCRRRAPTAGLIVQSSLLSLRLLFVSLLGHTVLPETCLVQGWVLWKKSVITFLFSWE